MMTPRTRSRQWQRMAALREQIEDLPHREECGPRWQAPLPRLGRRLQGEYITWPLNGKVQPPPRLPNGFRFLSVSAGSRRYQDQIVLVLWWRIAVK